MSGEIDGCSIGKGRSLLVEQGMEEGRSGAVERLVKALVLEGKEELVKLVEKW